MSTLELIRRHAELRDAHATVLQSLKYPETVALSAVLAAAHQTIQQHAYSLCQAPA